jgi:hypothetical protein
MFSVNFLFFFEAVSSMRPGMDSTSCILVEDAKAVAQDEEPRDLTSSQAPTEGEYSRKLCNCVGVLSCKCMSQLDKIYKQIILHFFP